MQRAPHAGRLNGRLGRRGRTAGSGGVVAVVDEGGGTGGFDGGEGFEDFVGVVLAFVDDPGVAGLEEDGLAFDVEFGFAFEDVADGFVVAGGFLLEFAGGFVFPEAHAHFDAGGEVALAHFAFGGGLVADFGDAGVVHRLVSLLGGLREAAQYAL